MMKKIVMLLFAAMALGACCNCYKGTARSQAPITGEQWRLVQMDGRTFTLDGDGEGKLDTRSFVITFGEEGRMTGIGACNRISAQFENDNSRGTLSIGGVAATRMACPEHGEQEARFLKILGEVDGYTIDGRLLMLFTNGEQKLILERVEE